MLIPVSCGEFKSGLFTLQTDCRAALLKPLTLNSVGLFFFFSVCQLQLDARVVLFWIFFIFLGD